jgi:hypothetical protein
LLSGVIVMLDVVFVALLQAASGPPENLAETPPAAQAETAEQAAERRRCRTRNATGSRLVRVERCRPLSRDEQEEARAAMEAFQGPSGWQSMDAATAASVNAAKRPF